MRIKLFIMVVSIVGCLSFLANAEVATASPTPVVAASPAPIASPTPVVVPQQSATEAINKVQPPPDWLARAISIGTSLPLVGPYLIEAMKILGVISSILTLLVSFLIAAMKVLVPVLKIAKMDSLAAFMEAFGSSNVMYWLKFFSMYNAKKE